MAESSDGLATPRRGFSTRAIHVGQEPDARTGAVTVPIYQTSTFAQRAPGEHQGYEYGRTANPTREALETCLADLEGTDGARCFASGMAAVDAVLRLLAPGDHLVVAADVYGGTWRQLTTLHADLDVSFVDLGDLDAVARTVRRGTRLVWAESPSNPRLRILDLPALADLTHERGARLVVDNTFATPALQQPTSLGADLMVHSTTKYLGGHSDVIGGAVCADAETTAALGMVQNTAGAVPGPFDAWLTLRGVRSLALRMERHCANAQRVAEFLAADPRVAEVHYPGLPTDPGHALATRQMTGFGGMVAFRPVGGAASARHVASRTRLFVLAESLGGVESLIGYPTTMSHAALRDTALAVPDDLLRLSVGIEDIDDLLADLDAALG